MKNISLAIIGSLFFAATSYAAKPQIQWNPDYDFSSIETFEWSEPETVSLEESNPFLHHHITNAIQYELTSHGLTETESGADVRVTYYSTIETDTRLQSTSVNYGFGNYGMRGWGYYGYGFGGPVYTDTRVIEIERGSLLVDIWDSATNELVWRGKVEDITISSDPQKTRKNVEKAITKMAKQADKLME